MEIVTATLHPTARALCDIVGAGACLTDQEAIAPYVTDYRRLYRGSAVCVVFPSSTQQVAQVLAWCHAHAVPVVPQGGNTSLMGGSVPAAGAQAVVVNLSRMNRVLEVDATNDTLTLQAGVTLHAARAAAEEAGRLFPLRIGSEGSCQIGGNLATNAGGTAVLRYGNMRDLVLGIEAVLPDGRIYSALRGLRKDNTGYDLKHLFVGSEGTLGIITAAVLKLYPQPTSAATAFVAVQDPEAAVRLLGEAKRIAGAAVTTFELVSLPALDLVRDYLGGATAPLEGRHDWMVLLELTGGAQAPLDAALEQLLEAGFEQGWVLDAAIAASLSQAQEFWRLREEISDAQTRAGGSIKCDVSMPLSRIADFVRDASAAVLERAPETRMVIYGHMGDGNVHFNPLRPVHASAPAFLAEHYGPVSHLVDGMAHALGGSVSAEHGIGVAKRDDLPLYKSEVEMTLMRQIKNALDPHNLLNPGKVLASVMG